MNPSSTFGVLALLVAVFLGGFLARQFVSTRLRSMRLRARFTRARVGERRAADLLERNGYRIEGRELETRYAVRLGGAARIVVLRADYVVARGSRRFVAEVKTGAAADIGCASTRRQLLEYEQAFGVDGVLLVDPERESIDRVDFRFRRDFRAGWLAIGAFLLGLAVAYAALR